MAATRIALRKRTSALVSRLINNPPKCLESSVAALIRRLFSTNERLTPADDTGSAVDVRCQGRSFSKRVRNCTPATTLFSDVFDPFFPTRSLSQVMNMMDQLIDDQFFNRNWDVKEDDDVLCLRIDLPGLGKEDVNVVVERDTLVIRGEVQKEVGEGEDSAGVQRRRYSGSGRIELPANRYEVDEIKAEMRHGVLKVMVPKVRDEERQDVVEVAVDG